MLPIVIAPQPVLRQIAKPVTVIDKRILDIIADLKSTLLAAKNPEGVGLAAPQIGYSLRLFLIRPSHKSEPQILINPFLLSSSKKLQSPGLNKGVYEGCLSIPAHYAPISRSYSVKIRYSTPLKSADGSYLLAEKTETFSGFSAHIIQHELDHLNGILFVDHALTQKSKLYQVSGKTWKEVEI